MKLLVDAGLVTREQRGKWAYYRVVPQAMQALGDTLRGPAAESQAAAGARER
jgi:ArsR family transcriptional regulator